MPWLLAGAMSAPLPEAPKPGARTKACPERTDAQEWPSSRATNCRQSIVFAGVSLARGRLARGRLHRSSRREQASCCRPDFPACCVLVSALMARGHGGTGRRKRLKIARSDPSGFDPRCPYQGPRPRAARRLWHAGWRNRKSRVLIRHRPRPEVCWRNGLGELFVSQ